MVKGSVYEVDVIGSLECENKIKEITGIDDTDMIKEFMLQLQFLKNNGCLGESVCKNIEELAVAYETVGMVNSKFAELGLLSDCSCLNGYEKSLNSKKSENHE